MIVISYRRDEVLRENLDVLARFTGSRSDAELILIDNNDDAIDRGHFLSAFTHHRYRKAHKNGGVPAGRNDGILHSSGDILIFLDDDAFVQQNNFLEMIGSFFDANPKAGIVTFKCVDFNTGIVDRAYFAHSDKSRDPNSSFKTYRYLGGASALRRSVIDSIGIYREEFFYSMEESDIAFRAIKAGYEIVYFPDICVRHLRHPAGRLPETRIAELMLLNKLCVNHMHLPMRYVVPSACLWTAYALWKSRGRANVVDAWWRYIAWVRAHRGVRRPVRGNTLQYFRLCGAALWR